MIPCGVQKCGVKKDTSTARARYTLESIDLGADGDRVKKERWERYGIFFKIILPENELDAYKFRSRNCGHIQKLVGLIGFGASLK